MKLVQPNNENWMDDFKLELNHINYEKFLEYIQLADASPAQYIPQSEMEDEIILSNDNDKDKNKPEVTKTNNENLKLLDSETLQKGIDKFMKMDY